MADYSLDAIGLKCPMPVLKTKKIIKDMKPGQVLEIFADDMGAKSDIPALLKKVACTLVELKEENGKLTFTVRKD
jgi:tRNA 2-thiouridine synthesizing protein A